MSHLSKQAYEDIAQVLAPPCQIIFNIYNGKSREKDVLD